MRKIKAVIFDLDGVICSTDEYHYLAWKTLAKDLNIYFDRAINNRLRGVSRMESLEIILERYTGPVLSISQKEELAEKKNRIYRDSLRRMSEEDIPLHVKQCLKVLRGQGLKLAIGSSSKNAGTILKQIRLDCFFDVVVDGTCIQHSKPHPEIFLKAAEELGFAPEECLVVEDSAVGVVAGHAGGFSVACLGDAAQNALGDYNMESICELLSIVEK